MEVDRPASLELGHLGIGDPHQPAQLALLQPDQPAESTVECDGGMAPQLGREGVPQHLRLGVVAGRAERLAQLVVVLVMAPAAGPIAVRAPGTLAVRTAGQHQAALRLAGMDATEAGGGEGHEQPRMPSHVSGTPLPPLSPAARS